MEKYFAVLHTISFKQCLNHQDEYYTGCFIKIGPFSNTTIGIIVGKGAYFYIVGKGAYFYMEHPV